MTSIHSLDMLDALRWFSFEWGSRPQGTLYCISCHWFWSPRVHFTDIWAFASIHALEHSPKCQRSIGILDPGSRDPKRIIGHFLIFPEVKWAGYIQACGRPLNLNSMPLLRSAPYHHCLSQNSDLKFGLPQIRQHVYYTQTAYMHCYCMHKMSDYEMKRWAVSKLYYLR